MIHILITVFVCRTNAATVESVENEMSTDSTRDSANSMSPPLGDDQFTPGSSSEHRHLSTDSTRDSGIDPDDSQKSSLASCLPSNNFLFLIFYAFVENNFFLILQPINTSC